MKLAPRGDLIVREDPMHHVTPMSMYFVIFGLLMVMTAITVLASRVNLGILNTPLALLIAGSKASLVILFFMHVKYSTRLTWVIVIGSFIWLGVLFVLTLADYVTRDLSVY